MEKICVLLADPRPDNHGRHKIRLGRCETRPERREIRTGERGIRLGQCGEPGQTAGKTDWAGNADQMAGPPARVKRIQWRGRDE